MSIGGTRAESVSRFFYNSLVVSGHTKHCTQQHTTEYNSTQQNTTAYNSTQQNTTAHNSIQLHTTCRTHVRRWFHIDLTIKKKKKKFSFFQKKNSFFLGFRQRHREKERHTERDTQRDRDTERQRERATTEMAEDRENIDMSCLTCSLSKRRRHLKKERNVAQLKLSSLLEW